MKQSTSFEDELPRAAAPAPSEDAARVEVPSVAGLDEQAAIDHVTAHGLRPEVELLDITDASLAGVVVEQTPVAGVAARRDDVIVLRVGELAADPPVSDGADRPIDFDEDDWFDVPLPQAFERSPAGQLAAGSVPHEADTTATPPAATAVRVRRRGRWLVLGAGLFVVALLLIFSRPEKPQLDRAPAPEVRTVTVQAPAGPVPPSGALNRRPRPQAPALGSQRPTRPRGSRELRSKSRSAPPPTPVVDAPAPPSGAGCEFCLERPSP